MKKNGPILIGGTGRSGTTILVRILGRHPSIFPLHWESQFLAAPGGLIPLIESQWREPDFSRFLSNMQGPWFYRLVNKDQPNQYAAGLCHDLTLPEVENATKFLRRAHNYQAIQRDGLSIASEFVHRLFASAVDRSGAVRWLEKTPRNLLYADRLFQIFPDMKFLHIIRDGRDVAASMLKYGFWPVAAGADFPELSSFTGRPTLELAARYWEAVLDLGRRASAKIPGHAYYELRLEDLVEDPRATLELVCDFLEEDLDAEMLSQKLDEHNRGRWKSEFSPSQIRVLEKLIGPALEREGYLGSDLANKTSLRVDCFKSAATPTTEASQPPGSSEQPGPLSNSETSRAQKERLSSRVLKPSSPEECRLEEVERWDKEWLSYLATGWQVQLADHLDFPQEIELPESAIDLVDLCYFRDLPIKLYASREALQGKKLMELGCGCGFVAKLIARYADSYLGTDYSQLALRIAKLVSPSNCIFVHLSEKTELRKFYDTIDTVVSRHFWIHQNFDGARNCLRFLAPFLKSGGTVYADFFHPREDYKGGVVLRAKEPLLREHPSATVVYSEQEIGELTTESGFRIRRSELSLKHQRRYLTLIKA